MAFLVVNERIGIMAYRLDLSQCAELKGVHMYFMYHCSAVGLVVVFMLTNYQSILMARLNTKLLR